MLTPKEKKEWESIDSEDDSGRCNTGYQPFGLVIYVIYVI
jgi:hypothetical protein